MNGLFITGTDTDVGKTILSALLLSELRQQGIQAAPMKPAQTGCQKKDLGKETDKVTTTQMETLSVPDLDFSLSMASMKVSPDEYQNMSPYRFEPACSPHLAAELAEIEIDISEIVIAARTLALKHEFIIAEGAGGIIVPLNRRESMLDLMHALKFPILIAARPGLGTINHTLLSIHKLQAEGLSIAGVVFITSENQDVTFIEEDNRITIEQFGKIPILGTIPFCPQLTNSLSNYSQLPVTITNEIKKIVNKLTLSRDR